MTGFEDDFASVDDTPTADDLWLAIAELGERIDLLVASVGPTIVLPERLDPAFASVDEWVAGWWAAHHARDLSSSQTAWCERWHEHPEALSRLAALWDRWEQLRYEPGGMAVWWRDADAIAASLLNPAGTFRHCKSGDSPRHRAVDPLPTSPESPGGPDRLA